MPLPPNGKSNAISIWEPILPIFALGDYSLPTIGRSKARCSEGREMGLLASFQ